MWRVDPFIIPPKGVPPYCPKVCQLSWKSSHHQGSHQATGQAFIFPSKTTLEASQEKLMCDRCQLAYTLTAHWSSCMHAKRAHLYNFLSAVCISACNSAGCSRVAAFTMQINRTSMVCHHAEPPCLPDRSEQVFSLAAASDLATPSKAGRPCQGIQACSGMNLCPTLC